MSYSFYSLVSSIKDKSSQAMATLSSDLKEFTSIVQEDVAEVASTVRKTVHEKSEALRQIAEQQQQQQESTASSGDHDEEIEGDAHAEDAPSDAKPRRASLFSFGGLSLEAMGSKLLHSADEFLGSLAGNAEDESKEVSGEDKLATARRYRLLALQEDDSTYLHPPLDVETFQKWRKVLSDEELATIQEEVLAHYPTVATKLAELVPESTTPESFWANYIYKASLLAAQEQRGADLLEHALNDDDEEVGWDVESPRQGEMDENESSHREYDDDEEDGHDDAHASVENGSPAEGSRGDDEDVAGRQSPATASSDGESWIELDEQRRELQTQPPLSSSSTSSFVPVAAVPDSTEGSQPPTTSQVIEGDEEEDVDWGDDEELNDTQVEQPTPSETSKKPDWGEWD